MYTFIFLFVLIAEEVNSQGDPYIVLSGPPGAVAIQSNITLTCEFRKGSKEDIIDLLETDENKNPRRRLKIWDKGDINYTKSMDGHVQYRHTVTGPGTYQCYLADPEAESPTASNEYTLHIWRQTNWPTTPSTKPTSTINETTAWTPRLITLSTTQASIIHEITGVPVENTTTNSTIVDGQEGHQIRLYIFLAVGVVAVVAVVICCCVFKRKHKKEMGERRNTMDSTRQTALTHNEQAHQAHLKQQGMVYADLEMVKAENAKIHGIENQVEYASLTWDKNKKAKGKNGGQK